MVDTRFAVSVHIMTCLAYAEGKMITSPTLANSIRTNPIVIRRLVAKLVEQGLVRSYRGKAGGLELARKPEEISLRDIYLASTERELVALTGKSAYKPCPVSCAMENILSEVVAGLENTSLDFLRQITVLDLARKVPRRP